MTHIWVPKMRILEPKKALLYRSRAVGLFKLDAIKPDGRVRPLTGWFPNLITNTGLNAIGTVSTYMNACRVGSGSATPSVTDTAMQSQIASSSSQFSVNRAAQGSPPYYASTTIVYRFNAGVAAGNLQEIGIATQGPPGGIQFSRALILDSGGNPTSITVESDEVLDATYQLRLYPPLADVEDTLNIDGNDYDTLLRAQEVTSTSLWALPAHAGGGGLNSARFGDGTIGATIADAPTGTSVLLSSVPSAYGDNSLFRQTTVTAGLDQANFAGGVDWASFFFGTPGGGACLGACQVQFTPAIPKNNTQTLSLVGQIAWARGTI